MDFETCTDGSCPTRGPHAHPVGDKSADYWLARLHKATREAEVAQKEVVRAAVELVAARARRSTR